MKPNTARPLRYSDAAADSTAAEQATQHPHSFITTCQFACEKVPPANVMQDYVCAAAAAGSCAAQPGQYANQIYCYSADIAHQQHLFYRNRFCLLTLEVPLPSNSPRADRCLGEHNGSSSNPAISSSQALCEVHAPDPKCRIDRLVKVSATTTCHVQAHVVNRYTDAGIWLCCALVTHQVGNTGPPQVNNCHC